jgi:hypothetical protein
MSNVNEITDQILTLNRTHPIRVGIDGFCAAGKFLTLVAGQSVKAFSIVDRVSSRADRI